jgi:hypothetical protein
MGLILTHHLLEPVARGLLGSISCSGGPTPEQQRLLQALLTHLWERPDLRIAALEPMGPEELAVALGVHASMALLLALLLLLLLR